MVHFFTPFWTPLFIDVEVFYVCKNLQNLQGRNVLEQHWTKQNCFNCRKQIYIWLSGT